MKKALIVIDAQNDYLTDGRFPLWDIETTLMRISDKILEFKKNDCAIIFIQHLSPLGSYFLTKQQKVVNLYLN